MRERRSRRKGAKRRGESSVGSDERTEPTFAEEVFDIPGTDPELLRSGRIPDPQPEHTPLFAWLAEVIGRVEEFLRARGGVSLRMGIRVVWGFIAAVGIFLLVGPVINEQPSIDDILDSASVSEVDWIARDVEIDYQVGRADDGTFEATVSEKFNANFLNGPEQSVKRSIVTEVNGHDTEFELLSVTVDGEPADELVRHRATTTDIEVRRPDGEQFEGEQEVVFEYRIHHLVTESTDSATDNIVDEWAWPFFGLTWPQGTKGLDVSVTLAHDINDALVREPRAAVGWLLATGTAWLEPDGETPFGVTYSFSNDDTLPPNSQVWVTTTFEHGTFELPPKTTLFWVQTYGPLIPLAVLVVLVLFSLAARVVVWADSAGKPWFVSRSEAPPKVSALLAAQLLGKTRHAELVAALEDDPKLPKVKRSPKDRKRREVWVKEAAQAGRRAGRLGNLPSVLRWAGRWSTDKTLIERKLRWVPDSYVRDTFIAAPIAVTLVQWGLLRQLSHQVILLVVWWPAIFVLVSTLLAAISLWAVWKPRPLTPEGALLVQDLKGIDVYSRSTRLVERGPIDEPLLPYAVLFESPRSAGDQVTTHAVQETGERGVAAGWRNQHFLSIPSMLAFAMSLALFVGSILLVSTQPSPYEGTKYQTYPSDDFSGSIWTQMAGFEVDAELTRDEDGAARLTVVERHDVLFTAGGSSVPQYVREWQSARLGQDLGFEIESVRIEGEDVPFRAVSTRHTTAIATQLTDVYEGMHEVEIRYSLSSPVVDFSGGNGDAVQQLRWAALMSLLWDDTYYSEGTAFGPDDRVRPLRVQFTVAADLVDEMQSGGWIDTESNPTRIPYESGTSYKDWVWENTTYLDDVEVEYNLETHTYFDEDGNEYDYENGTGVPSTRYEFRMGSEQTEADGSLVVVFDADEILSRAYNPNDEEAQGEPEPPFELDPEVNARIGEYEWAATNDVGVTIDFPAGTFTNVQEGAHEHHRLMNTLPIVLLYAFSALVIAIAVATIVWMRRTKRRASASLLLFSVGTMSLFALAQSVVFWWQVGPMRNDGLIGGSIAVGLLMWAAVVVQWIVVAIHTSKNKRS